MKNPLQIKNKVVVFLASMGKYDCYDTLPFDPGMKARVKSVRQSNLSSVIYKAELDLTEFEEQNKEVAIQSWCGKDGKNSKYWHETEYYPKDKKAYVTFYSEHPPFKVLKSI